MPPACGVGHNSQLERATGVRFWSNKLGHNNQFERATGRAANRVRRPFAFRKTTFLLAVSDCRRVQSVALKLFGDSGDPCCVGHNSQLERATGLRWRP